MKLTEPEMRMAYQLESTSQEGVLNELYMTCRYSRDEDTKATAESLMAKIRPLSDKECMALVNDVQKNYHLPGKARTIGEMLAEARQKSGAEKLAGHDIMALERFAPDTRHMIVLDVLSHESPMIYCADCGSRMGFISPEARQSGKHYDSDSAFQCGNYRNQNNECVSHFIKTSALEAAILQAIKAVSQYVIENEAEFISQLKTVWNESKSKSANNGQQEIDEAKKRMAELDAKIQKLYDSAISGLLPERQAQRMIQQYDEEQLMLEKRVEELQGQIQEEEVEKIDTNRFIALVNKYRNCEELTDTMLYAFIDRVEVHEATGGRTVYRQQNIDIYFNFIGNYYPPVETVSEEERIAAIEAEQLRKKQEKAKRAAEVQKQKKAALMKAVEAGDPEAIAEYERKLALQRERNHRRQQKIKEAREADPAYIAQMEEKERLQREKLLEAERKRTERANRQKKLSRKELKEAAKTDPKAAEEWQALKEKEAVARQRKKEREEERMAADPEYAAMMAERKAEYTRTRTAKRQAEREALVELAKTDEEAAKKLAEMRKYQSQATVRSYQKMKADAEAGDPDAIKRYETTLAKRREEYHRKKGA